MGSIFTGRLPYEHGAMNRPDALSAELATLAGQLADGGTQSVGFERWGFGRGFREWALIRVRDDTTKPEGQDVQDAFFGWLERADAASVIAYVLLTSNLIRPGQGPRSESYRWSRLRIGSGRGTTACDHVAAFRKPAPLPGAGGVAGGAAVSEQTLGVVAGLIRQVLGDDVAFEDEIDLETSFADDLELESIELVTLAEKIQAHYGAGVNFVGWLSEMELDQIIGLKVGDLVELIDRCR